MEHTEIKVEQAQTQTHACMVCGTSSDQRVVLRGEHEGREAWVCVGCLPMLIHGRH